MIIVINIKLDSMENHLKERFGLIDMYLYYWGRVQRKDLSRHFNVGPVTASRIFKAYSQKYPDNIEFNVNGRAYVKTDRFKLNHITQPETALELLAYGVESRPLKGKLYGPQKLESYTAPLEPEYVSAVTRAMTSSDGVGISYVSGSGDTKRTVYPHSIFQGGGAWYFRAFDSLNEEFRTFRFSRITGLTRVRVPTISTNQMVDDDWNTSVTLTLAPHNKHRSREALATDLGLKGRPVSNAVANKAMAGFVLIDLRVDCSASASLDPNEFPLQLQNRSELLDIESMVLAPGFNTLS